MSLITSILAFLLLLSFLILIHECGHFFAARKSKVIVEEFGFGLPPRAKKLFTQGGTIFSLNWIPFGGFVRLKGENAATEWERKAPGSFAGACYPSRILILTAGVLMNLAFALLIFTLGFWQWHWIPRYVSIDEMKEAAMRGDISMEAGVDIASVRADGTAAKAGVPSPSTILSIDGTPVYIPSDVIEWQKGKTQVKYELRTAGGTGMTLTVPVQDGKTGIELQFAPTVSAKTHSLPVSFIFALREVRVMTVQTILGIGELFTSLLERARVPEGITGIVGIAVMTHDTVQAGLMPYLRLVADLSLSLAILNILPFPALDGGRLFFVLAELLRKRPAPRRFELATNAIGFIFLLLLIVIITYHDILKLF